MKINGIKRRGYFHHYFPAKGTRGLHLYNLAMGVSLWSVGVHWCPWSAAGREGSRHPFPGSGYHIWISLPFVSLMLEWRR